MKMSRRGILAGLLVAAGVKHTAAAPIVDCGLTSPPAPDPIPFPKGFIRARMSPLIPRPYNHGLLTDPGHSHPTCVIDYDVFDGERWVNVDSPDGVRVVTELRQ